MLFSKSRRIYGTLTSREATRAFGLIELMVSVSIITLVSAVILSRHTSFNGAVLLRNQTYEIAFAVRQAQLLAVSGNTGVAGASRQYGLHVNTANPTTYIVFQDNNNNERYDGASEQIGNTGRLDSRFQIRDITNNGGTSLPTTGVSIIFVRPNFDAAFYDASGNEITGVGEVYIDIAQVGNTGTDAGDARRVEVSSTGQVRVVTF
jgi:Tfp pilus assembly protein FimT